MTKWTVYVQSFDNNADLIEINIDSESTFLELRKKAADALNTKWEDLILATDVEYDKAYNSKILSQINIWDIHNESTLYAIHSVNGGTFRN